MQREAFLKMMVAFRKDTIHGSWNAWMGARGGPDPSEKRFHVSFQFLRCPVYATWFSCKVGSVP